MHTRRGIAGERGVGEGVYLDDALGHRNLLMYSESRGEKIHLQPAVVASAQKKRRSFSSSNRPSVRTPLQTSTPKGRT